MMTAIAEQTDLDEVLREINDLEARLEALRELLPVEYRQIFVFACRPERRVWLYAENSEQAIAKLHDRMNSYYRDNWDIVSNAVTRYSDPNEACQYSPGNLLRQLTRQDAELLIQDFRANQKGKAPKPQTGPTTGLEKDIANYELWLETQ